MKRVISLSAIFFLSALHAAPTKQNATPSAKETPKDNASLNWSDEISPAELAGSPAPIMEDPVPTVVPVPQPTPTAVPAKVERGPAKPNPKRPQIEKTAPPKKVVPKPL